MGGLGLSTKYKVLNGIKMLKIVLTVVIMFILQVPFFSTPVGENLFLSYQDTKLHKVIYCQYVEWFGAEGFENLKYLVKCKLDLKEILK